MKHPCIACPFRDGENEEATQAQNYACLPTAFEMLELFDKQGLATSCHNSKTKPCRGLARERCVQGAEVKAYEDWYRNG
jgi:hypothetical protein